MSLKLNLRSISPNSPFDGILSSFITFIRNHALRTLKLDISYLMTSERSCNAAQKQFISLQHRRSPSPTKYKDIIVWHP